ncbi:unnamed protein product [Tuber aestivum]|uniref:VASt domain-containing protein n=1 Tax=Tuber aestivum TaxID=59557 RepID=A0A292QA31_9PEZI|nr:unnamed protein product [Tuber aestivum]
MAAAAARPTHPITDASGYLTLSSPPSNGQSSPSGSRRPSHAATFSSYSDTTATVTTGNTKPESGSGKKVSGGILGVPFLRRTTSPQPPEKRTNTNSGTGGSLSGLIPTGSNPSALSQSSHSEARPATSGGEAGRVSEDRNQRPARSSVGTSDGSDIAAAISPKVVSSEHNAKPWPTILTETRAQPIITSESGVNADGTIKTTITPPTPTDSQHFPLKSPVGAVQAGDSGMKKRSRANSLSNAPSKLSQSMTAPLTPTIEGGATPDTSPQPGLGNNTSGGFFQSMFSVAQNAATTLGNAVANANATNTAGGIRSRSGTGASETEREMVQQGGGSGSEAERSEPQKRPAVETLGQGELSLGSLGILPNSQKSSAPPSEGRPSRSASVISHGANSETGDNRVIPGSGGTVLQTGVPAIPVHRAGFVDGSLDDEALRSLDSAVSSRGGFETAVESAFNSPVVPGGSGGLEILRKTPVAEDSAFAGRDGDHAPEKSVLSPPDDRDDTWSGDVDRRRSGSVRSGGRRKRGSSAASGANPQPVPRPTGFAVAPKRRNREFHEMFRSVPEDDYLIEDYGCALQKEILLQGRLYVSEGHICFYSNIFGWVNTLIISFDEIVSVEKKNTAMLFPNAIVIQTLHARNVFASFISRDSTYDLIVGIWKIGHPQLVAGATGVRLEDGGDAEEGDPVDGVSEYEEEDGGDDEYEDASNDELEESYTDAGDVTLSDDKGKNASGGSKSVSRKASQAVLGASGGDGSGAVVDYPGPQTHPPTSCNDDHYDRPLCDDIISAPLGRVYSLIFGPASLPFMSRFLADEEKVLELSIPDKGEWIDGPDGKKTRSFSYIKPLGGGIGPKQTKCNITETLDNCDLEDHVIVTATTQTPDVPSGNVFMVKTRYCLMWADDNRTRLVATCTVEWSGKSWLKGSPSPGPIEKGANDGQIAYNKNLRVALKREVEPREPIGKRSGNKIKKRKKDLNAKGEAIGRAAGGTLKGREAQAAGFESPTDQASWGVFAPLKAYLGPAADIISPLIGGAPGLVAICLVLTVFFWWQSRNAYSRRADAIAGGGSGVHRPHQHWDTLWRSEEDGLWEWLEDRVGINEVVAPPSGRASSFEKIVRSRHEGAGAGLAQGMKRREVEDAIGVMEERLAILRRVVEDRRYGDGTD